MFMSPNEQIPSVVELLNELSEENAVPRNVKAKLSTVV